MNTKRLTFLSFILSGFLLFTTGCESQVTFEAPNRSGNYAFWGNDISGDIEVIGDDETKIPSITVTGIEDGKEWTVYAVTADNVLDISKPIETINADGTYPLSVTGGRNYFRVVAYDGSIATVAERRLPTEGAYNFRDLGGYRAKDGRRVKWGKFLRSEALNRLTEKDIEYIASLPLVSIADLRGQSEINSSPDKSIPTVKNVFGLNLAITALPGNTTDERMMNLNRQLVTNATYVNIYKEFFKVLQDENNLPLVFHCSAGKDRTGMAAALILFALGVDKQTVLDDFMLSHTYLKNSQWGPEAVKLIWLQAGLDTIDATYGSVEKFLTGTLEVDLNAFRNKYLYSSLFVN